MLKRQLSLVFFAEKIRLGIGEKNENTLKRSLNRCYSAFESVVNRTCMKFVESNKKTFDEINKQKLKPHNARPSATSSLDDSSSQKESIIQAKRRMAQEQERASQARAIKEADAKNKADMKTAIKILDLEIQELYKECLSKSYKLIGKPCYDIENPFDNTIDIEEIIGLEVEDNEFI